MKKEIKNKFLMLAIGIFSSFILSGCLFDCKEPPKKQVKPTPPSEQPLQIGEGDKSNGKDIDAELTGKITELQKIDFEDDEQKSEVWQQIIDTIDVYLPKLDSSNRKKWKDKREELEKQKRNIDDDIKFKTAKKRLEKKLADNISAGEKRQAIERFLDDYRKYSQKHYKFFDKLNQD